MGACCSSADSTLDDVSTLRYADCAKQIRNRPNVNHDARSAELDCLRAEVGRLADEIASLRRLPVASVQERRPLNDVASQTLQSSSEDAENTRLLNEFRTENTRLLNELRDQVTRCAAAELVCGLDGEKNEPIPLPIPTCDIPQDEMQVEMQDEM